MIKNNFKNILDSVIPSKVKFNSNDVFIDDKSNIEYYRVYNKYTINYLIERGYHQIKYLLESRLDLFNLDLTKIKPNGKVNVNFYKLVDNNIEITEVKYEVNLFYEYPLNFYTRIINKSATNNIIVKKDWSLVERPDEIEFYTNKLKIDLILNNEEN